MTKSRLSERLLVIVLLGFLALNFPLLDLFSRDVLVFGIPILYLYVFFVWAILIGLVTLAIEHTQNSRASHGRRRRPGN